LPPELLDRIEQIMSRAQSIFQGEFGRVALLDMDRSLVPHAHRACHVLLKFGGGDTAFDVRGRTCALTDRTAVVVNAWEQHAYKHADGAAQSHILALYIDPVWLAGIDRQLITSGHAQFFSYPEIVIGSRVADRARELGTRMTLMDEIDRASAERAVFELMIDVIEQASNRRDLQSQQQAVRQADYRIRRVIAWLREHVGEPLDPEAMAKVAGLSRAHFFSQFKAMTGLSPALFLNTLRMEAAAGMLAHEDQTLTAIGQDLGFSAPGNFTRFFREHQGVTPSEYRRVAQFF
jgi:AraC family transcriptional regulator